MSVIEVLMGEGSGYNLKTIVLNLLFWSLAIRKGIYVHSLMLSKY